MDEPDNENWDEDLPDYRPAEDISSGEIAEALNSLYLLQGDPYLAMQITGITLVDQFIMDVEYDVLKELIESERTPPNAVFLSAQTQMWIFAVYELLRTWREQAKDVIKWAKNGGLKTKIDALERKLPYRHHGREIFASRLRKVLQDLSIVGTIEADLRRTHYLFNKLEHLRISMAKHQVRGKQKSIAFAPGYGRINQWCGSLEYQLEAGQAIFGSISRRDIADGLRSFRDRSKIPTVEDIGKFDEAMKAMLKAPPDFLTDDQQF